MVQIKKAKLGLSAFILLGLTYGSQGYCVDDGSQMADKFRVNYAGYYPQASKTAIYIAENTGSVKWKISGTSCQGVEDTYVSNDKSSGDSFYLIDFSRCTTIINGAQIQVNNDVSHKFNISNDPYGSLKYEFFDFFRDHEGKATFSNAKNNWAKDLNISFSYVKDAGDDGAYPVNTAEASWALINLLETYPAVNEYYSKNHQGARSVYAQLSILTEQFDHVFDYGGVLAIPKFHTNVNDSWAKCTPHKEGTCIAEPETKATYSAARTLAAMSRLHLQYGDANEAKTRFVNAKKALVNAMNEPLRCNQADSFGGEGGMYPDNDNTSLLRDPKQNNDNCVADKNNTQDDEYASLVEIYLAAIKLAEKSDVIKYKALVQQHPRYNEVSSYWWGAVAMEGSLSLLTHEKAHDLNLSVLKARILAKADSIISYQNAAYPGVTWDPYSTQWNNGDQDDVDNNVRWGSHRMALNDARILMAAAEISKQSAGKYAAKYARGAVKVLDHISGLNPINIAMFTAKGYSEIENSLERTHDGADPKDEWPGKMVLGPNNWTNVHDPAMPKFGSLPGLKMFVLQGAGWSSREISIDANASIVPVSYFAQEVATDIMKLEPIN